MAEDHQNSLNSSEMIVAHLRADLTVIKDLIKNSEWHYIFDGIDRRLETVDRLWSKERELNRVKEALIQELQAALPEYKSAVALQKELIEAQAKTIASKDRLLEAKSKVNAALEKELKAAGHGKQIIL